MKNTIFRLMLAITMILLLVTGCGGSSGESPTKKQDTSAEQDTGAEKTRYLMKTRKQYRVSDSGEKEPSSVITYEYDENGNCVHERYEYLEEMVFIHDDYHIYELDEEGRVIVRHDLDERGEKTRSAVFSYVDDQFTCEIYSFEEGVVTFVAKGFVRDGEVYETEVKYFDAEHPATENGGGYFQKDTYKYDGTRVIEEDLFDQNDEMFYQHLFEYELDENGNPLVKTWTLKDIRTGDVDEGYFIEEFTYKEFEYNTGAAGVNGMAENK